MKILKIIHGFPPECSGGTESYVLRLAKELLALGHEVEVLAGSMQGAGVHAQRAEIAHEQVEGILVHRLHRTGLYVDNWEKSLAPEVAPRVQAVLRDFAPDLVHVHHWVRLSRNLIEICHDAGIPAVATLHDVLSVHPVGFRITEESRKGVQFGDPSTDRLAPILSGHLSSTDELRLEYELYCADLANELHLARRLIVPSLAHRDTILEFQPRLDGHFRVLPHGNISTLAPKHARDRRERTPGQIRIGHWGHLSRLKGIDLLLEAVQGSRFRDRIHLDLFGEVVFPDERPLVDELAAGLNITWHGAYQPADLAEVPLDLAVIPTRCNESWSFVLDEAILLGLPVLGPDRGAIGERLRNRGGLFRADDVLDLRARIEEAIEDPGRLDEWARRNPRLVTMSEHTDGVLGVYREVLTSRAPLPRTPDALRSRRLEVRTWQLESQKSARAHQESRLGNLGQDLAGAQATLKEMDHFHREKDKVIEGLQSANADLGKQLEEAQAAPSSQAEVERLQALLAARDGEVAGLESRLSDALTRTEARIESMRSEVRQKIVDARLARDELVDSLRRELSAARKAGGNAIDTSALETLDPNTPVLPDLKGEADLIAALEQFGGLDVEASNDLGPLIAALPDALGRLCDAVIQNLTGLDHGRKAQLEESLSAMQNRIALRLRGVRDQLHALLADSEDAEHHGSQRDVIRDQLVQTIEDLLASFTGMVRRNAAPPRLERGRSSRLKILYVVHQFLPRHVAGTELYTYHLAKELSERHDVTILTAETDPGRERFELQRTSYDGLPIWQVIHNYRWHDFQDTYDCPEADALFRRVLREERPDIVHIQHLHHFSVNFVTIAKMHGVPVVYTLHDYGLVCPNDGKMCKPDGQLCNGKAPHYCVECIRHPVDSERHPPLVPRALRPGTDALVSDGVSAEVRRKRTEQAPGDPMGAAIFERYDYLKRVLEDVDLFISPSSFLRDRMVEAGMMEAERIIVSDNGYDLSPFQNIQRQPSSGLRVGFVGTVAEHKGPHVLVEAMNGIEDSRVSCQIWGDLSSFAAFGDRLREMSTNERTMFMGPFPPSSLATVLASLDLLVVPSLWYENSPLTVHEAALAQLPVLVSDIGGLAEYVKEGITGRRFRMGDAEHLRERLLQFLNEPMARFDPTALKVKPIAQDALETEARYLDLRQRALVMADR